MKCVTRITILVLLLAGSLRSYAQSTEVQQLLLNVEKLSQLKNILRDMEDGYKMLTKYYGSIKGIAEGNFKLHEVFLDGLLEVSPTVKNYRKVAAIIAYQRSLVSEYKKALGKFRSASVFNASEMAYVENVYDNLVKESLRSLDMLLLVITASNLRMSDDERLKAIDMVHVDVEDMLTFLRVFNKDTAMLALQRERESRASKALRAMYGLEKSEERK